MLSILCLSYCRFELLCLMGLKNYMLYWANEDDFLLRWDFKSLMRTEKQQAKMDWNRTVISLSPTFGTLKLPLAALQSQ